MNLRWPPELVSLDQVEAAYLELDRYRVAFEQAQRRGGTINQTPGPELSALMAIWFANGEPDPRGLLGLQRALEDARQHPVEIHLVLTALPSHKLKQELTAWLRSEIAPELLVNFSASRDLGGGMVLRVGSRVFDWSFRRSILEHGKDWARILDGV